MTEQATETSPLSVWWRHGVILVMVIGFATLSFVTVKTYSNAPPIPGRVTYEQGATLFTRDDIEAGQEVFLKYALMEHGTLWGHGAYLGPDYSAEYLTEITHGYWHARRLTFLMAGTFHVLEWLRIGADMIFIVVGVVPLVLATVLRVLGRRPVGDHAASSS